MGWLGKYWIVVLILIPGIIFGQQQEHPHRDYMALLQKACLAASGNGQLHSGYELFRDRETYRVLADKSILPIFIPHQGLVDPNAVPFLIDIVQHGPGWDKETLKSNRGIYPFVARYYAVLCLGKIRDPRGYPVLLDTLERGEIIDRGGIGPSDDDTMTRYAAIALGYFGNPEAIKPLFETFKTTNNTTLASDCVLAIGDLGDARMIRPIVDHAEKQPEVELEIHRALENISKKRLRFREYKVDSKTYVASEDFPDMAPTEWSDIHRFLLVWKRWLKEGGQFTDHKGQNLLGDWTKVRTDLSNPLESKEIQKKIEDVGIAALPLLIEKIRSGETDLIPVVCKLTDGKLKASVTQESCLAWWEANKEKYLIPFEDTKQTGH